MIFRAYQLPVRSDIPTGSYLIADAVTREAAWVDAALYAEEVLKDIEQLRLKISALLLTHGHYDHTGGIEQAMEEFHCPLYGHQADAPSIKGGFRPVRHGDRLKLGSRFIEVYETTGHTPGSVTYRVERYAFVGDALFAGSVGGTANPELFRQQQQSIRQNLFPLGDDLIVCPGHGPMSTLGVERLHNPFFD